MLAIHDAYDIFRSVTDLAAAEYNIVYISCLLAFYYTKT